MLELGRENFLLNAARVTDQNREEFSNGIGYYFRLGTIALASIV